MAKIKEAIEEHKVDPRLLDERGPTKERLRRAETINPKTGEVVDFYERGNASRAYTFRDTPFERSFVRGQITEGQYQAGGKFYVHWYRAGMRSNLGSVDLDGVFSRSTGALAATESGQFHYDRFKDAVRDMGQLGSAVVTSFVCYDMPIEEIGQKHLNYTNKPQARAAATTLIRDKLEGLRVLWGMG